MQESQIGRIVSPLQADLDGVADRLVDLLGCDLALLSFDYNTSLVSLGLSATIGCSGGLEAHVPADLLCLHRGRHLGPAVVVDAKDDPSVSSCSCVRSGLVGSFMSVPIKNQEVGAVGLICALSKMPRDWMHQELQLLSTVATSVENLILKEMFRAESVDASRLLSEYDQIISAFSMVQAAPTSIHNRTGRLVFANRSLSHLVSTQELESRRFQDILLQTSGAPMFLYSSRGGRAFEVRRRETHVEYWLCQWADHSGALN